MRDCWGSIVGDGTPYMPKAFVGMWEDNTGRGYEANMGRSAYDQWQQGELYL